jgi:hypothetical protein
MREDATPWSRLIGLGSTSAKKPFPDLRGTESFNVCYMHNLIAALS